MVKKDILLPKSYRNIGLGFFLLSILVLGSVIYLISAKATIVLSANLEKVDQELLFTVKEGASASDGVVSGKIKVIDLFGSDNFAATGSKKGESDVVGEVTIINNYNKEQTLIASTRLAFANNPQKVILRLKKTVTVAPGQKLKVPVYPEDLKTFSDLVPSRFVFPGLWAGLQDKIYAENESVLKAGGNVINFVTQDDLDKAQNSLKDGLYQKALTDINAQLEAQEILWPKLVSVKVEEMKFDAESGAEVSEFSGSMKLKATVVVFDENQIIGQAKNKIKSGLSAEKQLIDIDAKSLKYAVLDYNLEIKEAKIKVNLSAESVLAKVDALVDKNQLTNKTAEEIKNYFSQFPQIKSVEVKFRPAWLIKTPRSAERIEIKVGE